MKALHRGITLVSIISIAAATLLSATPAQADETSTLTSGIPKITVVHNDSVRLIWDGSTPTTEAPFTGQVEMRWPGGAKVVQVRRAESTILSGVPSVKGVQFRFTDTKRHYLPSGWSKALNYLLPAQAKAPKLSVKDSGAERTFRIGISPNVANGSAKVQHYQINFQHRSRKSIVKKREGWNDWHSYFTSRGEDPFSDSSPGMRAKSKVMSGRLWGMRNVGSSAQITRYQYRTRVRACSGTAKNGYYALCGAWSSWSNTVLVAHGKLR
jgi:hypothetical protein